MFNKKSSGIHTGKDHLVIDFDKENLLKRVNDVKNEVNEDIIRAKYNLKDTSGWKLERFKSTQNDITNYVKLLFRVFDERWIIYENKALKRDRIALMKNIFKKDNYSLVTIRRSRSNSLWNFIFVSKLMTTEPTTITSLDNNYNFPLYLYPDTNGQQKIDQTAERTPNLKKEIVNQIAENLGLTY